MRAKAPGKVLWRSHCFYFTGSGVDTWIIRSDGSGGRPFIVDDEFDDWPAWGPAS